MTAAPHVLFVHPSDEMYGADRILLQVIEALPAHVTAEVWLPTDLDYPERRLSRELAARGVAVRRMALPVLRRQYLRPAALPRLAWQWLRTLVALVRHRPHLLYLNTSACLPLAPMAALLRRPVVLHVHESWSDRERRLLRPFHAGVTAVVAVSNAVAARLPAALRRRAQVIYNGLPVPEPRGDEPRSGPSTFLLASRWNAWKGHRELLAAWGRISRPDARLVILGGPPPSGESVDVPALVADLPNSESVRIVGEVADATAHVVAADCVLIPSVRPDPLPTIALEAAALQRPVLASDEGGLREIVEDGVTGRLVPAGDVDAWAAAIDAFRVEEVAAMGQAARQRFDQLFSVERFRTDISAVLQRALARGSAQAS